MNVRCRICEEEVDPDKLYEHSTKCKEVAEIKEAILEIKGKLVKNGERAYEMNNIITTNAAVQKYKYLILY